MAHATYSVSNFLLKGALRAFAHWEVEGRENVPPFGPLIVVANHQSNLDPPLLGVSIPRRLRYMAKRKLFKSLFGTFLRAYGAMPLDLDGRDVAALRGALHLLSCDGALVLFPEGHRYPGQGMHRASPGVAYLALKSQAPVLPVGITGTERIGPIWRVVFPTGHLRVRIGQAFTLPAIEGKLPRQQLEALTTMIMQRVAALLPPQYQGVYRLPETSPARQ
ncbi:MAG: 1-acyl-sn-glycerol-3-phosphate acyltransferase [Chloroflexi bacterium]|nr:1-acyl-sn-glycerol-3-phosphate acyltransferase [Chloroflexota bacterium]